METPGQAAGPNYSCEGLPEQRLPDLELLALYRQRFGDAIVNEQIATLGTDRVIKTMQQAHQAHLIAQELSHEELHRRAELMESLMLEFGVPALGAAPDTQTDIERVQMFVSVVKGLADEVAMYQMREETSRFPAYDVVEPDDEASIDDDYISDDDVRPF